VKQSQVNLSPIDDGFFHRGDEAVQNSPTDSTGMIVSD
jgi:hypothetical protein